MATLTIHNIDEIIASQMRALEAQHGCTVEQAALHILADGLAATRAASRGIPFGKQLRRHLKGAGEFAIPSRNPVRAPPDLSGSRR